VGVNMDLDALWANLQQMAVIVLWWPLLTLAAVMVGAAILLAIAELGMYIAYRVLTRVGMLD
jgi:hypothetical protein